MTEEPDLYNPKMEMADRMVAIGYQREIAEQAIIESKFAGSGSWAGAIRKIREIADRMIKEKGAKP
jgi:hypothetical protein